MMRPILISLLFLISFSAFGEGSFNNKGWVAPLDDAALEERAVSLGRQFKCVQCKGQSIEESNADIALDMRLFIRNLIKEGKSDTQIIAIMRNNYKEKYGDALFMMPTTHLNAILLWIGPFIFLLIGAIIVYYTSFRKKKAPINQEEL